MLKLTKRKYITDPRSGNKDGFARYERTLCVKSKLFIMIVRFNYAIISNSISNSAESSYERIDKISIQKSFRFTRDIDLDKSYGEYGSIEWNYVLRRQRHFTITLPPRFSLKYIPGCLSRRRVRRIASPIFLRKLVALRFSSFSPKRERPLIHDHFSFPLLLRLRIFTLARFPGTYSSICRPWRISIWTRTTSIRYTTRRSSISPL